MIIIQRRQEHRALVEEIDYYKLTDEQYEEYLKDEDGENYILNNGIPWHESYIGILDLFETVEVELVEVV